MNTMVACMVSVGLLLLQLVRLEAVRVKSPLASSWKLSKKVIFPSTFLGSVTVLSPYPVGSVTGENSFMERLLEQQLVATYTQAGVAVFFGILIFIKIVLDKQEMLEDRKLMIERMDRQEKKMEEIRKELKEERISDKKEMKELMERQEANMNIKFVLTTIISILVPFLISQFSKM
jgi:hypothetical protein